MNQDTPLDPTVLATAQPVLDAWQEFMEQTTHGDTVEAVLDMLVVAWFSFCRVQWGLSELELVRYLYEHWLPMIMMHVRGQVAFDAEVE